MLSQLDHILWPNRCEVYETVPSQRYVYAIFKNGRTSLLNCAQKNRWRILFNEQISKLASVDVILRDPHSRMISGINIYLQQVMRENPSLDRPTAIWFIKNYLFLNRHFSPQFHWIFNLSRYMKSEAKLNFFDMSELDNIVDRNDKPTGFDEIPEHLDQEIGDVLDADMYHRIDQALIDNCLGKSLHFKDVMETIQNADPIAYEHAIGRTLKILKSIDVLSSD